MWSIRKKEALTRQEKPATLLADRDAGLSDALQIWARQIDNVQRQTETAVVELSGSFGNIVEKLDSSITHSQHQSALHADAAAIDGQQAEQNLSLVINALRDIQRSRESLTEELTTIVAYTSELQKMAEEIKMIAFQTNMLSLNAAIEAAHAGESGKGFGVVAHEVQLLSQASRDTGQNIDKRIRTINEAILKIAEHNHSASNYDNDAIQRSEANIRTVLERQRKRTEAFTSDASSVRSTTTTIRNEIEDALVKLQFQDRVSQILSQIVQAMQQNNSTDASVSAAEGNVINLDRGRLNHMAITYTTDEQRRLHDGLEAKAAAPRDVTFF